jgi:hypothetical protein
MTFEDFCYWVGHVISSRIGASVIVSAGATNNDIHLIIDGKTKTSKLNIKITTDTLYGWYDSYASDIKNGDSEHFFWSYAVKSYIAQQLQPIIGSSLFNFD